MNHDNLFTCTVSKTLLYGSFGTGLSSVHLDNVHCTGDEETLFQCRHDGVGIHNCGNFFDDAGVVCYTGRLCQFNYTHGCLMFYIVLIVLSFVAAQQQTQVVREEMYVWLMEMPQQEEWKFVSVVYGVWCVMIHGISMMLKSPAENLDY